MVMPPLLVVERNWACKLVWIASRHKMNTNLQTLPIRGVRFEMIELAGHPILMPTIISYELEPVNIYSQIGRPPSRSTPRRRAARRKSAGLQSFQQPRVRGRKFKIGQFRFFDPFERRAIQRPRPTGNQLAGEKFQANGLLGV